MGEDLPENFRGEHEKYVVKFHHLLTTYFCCLSIYLKWVPIDHRISGPDPRTLDLRFSWRDRHVTEQTDI